ncbi:alpha/beta hydrolase [Cyanobium sp. N.Huapi 1H5]|nr:alpha/beta hydrolase [Cyanobium sp. N.Huapi 1H5]
MLMLMTKSTSPPVFKRILAGLFVGTAVTASVLPASAAVDNDLPVRWNTGGAVWSTHQSAFDTFLDSGDITDRGLEGGLARSGWTSDEVKSGMTKTYSVNLVGVSRFLYSDAGVKFLKNATNSYFPYYSMNTYAVQALRSAIISDAKDGSISSAGIMKALPTDFRLADFCNTYTGAQNICAEGRCQAGTAQCTSLLSWYVFLPACIQANQMADPVAMVRETPAAPAPMMDQPVRGLW